MIETDRATFPGIYEHPEKEKLLSKTTLDPASFISPKGSRLRTQSSNGLEDLARSDSLPKEPIMDYSCD